MKRYLISLEQKKILNRNEEINQFRTFERKKHIDYEEDKLEYTKKIQDEIEKNRILGVLPSPFDLSRVHNQNMAQLAARQVEMKIYHEKDLEKKHHEIMTRQAAEAKHAHFKIQREIKQNELIKIYETQKVLAYREKINKYNQEKAKIENEFQLLKESTCNHLSNNYLYDANIDLIEYKLLSKRQKNINSLNRRFEIERENFINEMNQLKNMKIESEFKKEAFTKNLQKVSSNHFKELKKEDKNFSDRFKLKQDYIENSKKIINLIDKLNVDKMEKMQNDYMRVEVKHELNENKRKQEYLNKLLNERLKLEAEKDYVNKMDLNELKRKIDFEKRLEKLKLA
jgi:hypothetical protein